MIYVIGHKDGDPTRRNNLIKVIDHVKHKFTVVVVDQSETPKPLPGINWIPVAGAPKFNKAWCYNIVFKEMNPDIIFCADNDVIIPNIDDSIAALTTYDAVNPYDRIFDIQEAGGRVERKNINFCGGCCGYTRHGYEVVYGWDEEFLGWGGEDNVQTYKTLALLRNKTLPGDALHLWHPAKRVCEPENLKIVQLMRKFSASQFSAYYKPLWRTYGSRNKYLHA